MHRFFERCRSLNLLTIILTSILPCVPVQKKSTFPGSLQLAHSIASLSQVEQVEKHRTILLCLNSPPAIQNDLCLYSKRERKRIRGGETGNGVTTRYCLKGYIMCVNGFLAVVQLSYATIQQHAGQVGNFILRSCMRLLIASLVLGIFQYKQDLNFLFCADKMNCMVILVHRGLAQQTRKRWGYFLYVHLDIKCMLHTVNNVAQLYRMHFLIVLQKRLHKIIYCELACRRMGPTLPKIEAR